MEGERCETTGKLIYITRAKAERRLRALAKDKFARDNLGNYAGGKMNAYRCKFCEHFHIGHFQVKQTKRVKIRFEPIDE